MSTTARAEIRVDASRGRLWQALTDPDTISRFLFGSRVETDWRQGSPIVYHGEWEGRPYEDRGVILEIEPEHRLVTSYYSPLSGKPDEPESYQTVSYLLADDGARTRVTITQDGCADEAEAERMAANWTRVLQTLKSVVEEA